MTIDARGADDGRVEARDAQAAFFFELHAVALDEFGIDHHDEPLRIAGRAKIDDEDPQRHADLRRGESDARRRVHRLDHVVDEPFDVGGDVSTGRAAS